MQDKFGVVVNEYISDIQKAEEDFKDNNDLAALKADLKAAIAGRHNRTLRIKNKLVTSYEGPFVIGEAVEYYPALAVLLIVDVLEINPLGMYRSGNSNHGRSLAWFENDCKRGDPVAPFHRFTALPACI